MSTSELNAEVYRSMSIIAEDENALKRVVKYLRKVAKEITEDTARMTKEEFLQRVDNARMGVSHEMLPDEDLTSFLKRQGYAL